MPVTTHHQNYPYQLYCSICIIRTNQPYPIYFDQPFLQNHLDYQTMSKRKPLTFSHERQNRDPRGSFRKQLDELIRSMRRVRRSSLDPNDRPVGARTADARTDELFRMFDTLRLTLGYKIESPHGLRHKHVEALIKHWQEQELAISTIQNRLSILRVFAELALGKRGLIAPMRDYLPGVTRARAATEDKSISAKVDPELMIMEAMDLDEGVGAMLWLQATIGMRVTEALCLRPIQNDLGDALAILEGTKGGKPRTPPVYREDQRAAIDAAKIVASTRRGGHLSRPGLTLAQARRRFYYICEKIGLTRKGLGVTPHGFRHDRVQQLFKEVTGVNAPVKALPASAPDEKTVADISVELRTRAQYIVAHTTGHNRKSSAAAYLGAMPPDRRKALYTEPLPANDPHAQTSPLNDRMARMATRASAATMAREFFAKNKSGEHAAASEEADARASSAPSVAAPDPTAEKDSSASTVPSRAAPAAQPQHPVRNVSAAAARETKPEKPAKPGLVARFLGKKKSREQLPPASQENRFSAPPAGASDASPANARADDRPEHLDEDPDWY